MPDFMAVDLSVTNATPCITAKIAVFHLGPIQADLLIPFSSKNIAPTYVWRYAMPMDRVDKEIHPMCPVMILTA
jgi:hypothetical protein